MSDDASGSARSRLDVALGERGVASSRSQARDLIKRGRVLVDGVVETRPSRLVDDKSKFDVEGNEARFVSRGALKLEAALDHFRFDPHQAVALDVGASTGGFTQVLLERGVVRVYAVDVGQNQLHATLRDDPRVVNLERTDARALDVELVPDAIGAIVADVSFISLEKVMPAAIARSAPGCWLVLLIKPQFEVGRSEISKGGIVRSEQARNGAVEKCVQWVRGLPGWKTSGVIPSPVSGGDGNQEFLLGARRG